MSVSSDVTGYLKYLLTRGMTAKGLVPCTPLEVANYIQANCTELDKLIKHVMDDNIQGRDIDYYTLELERMVNEDFTGRERLTDQEIEQYVQFYERCDDMDFEDDLSDLLWS